VYVQNFSNIVSVKQPSNHRVGTHKVREHAGPTGELLAGSDPLAKGKARALCSAEALVSCSSGLENKISSSSGRKKKKGKSKLA